MIKECNFKKEDDVGLFKSDIRTYCMLAILDSATNGSMFHKRCVGEDNCILYQTYRLLQEK